MPQKAHVTIATVHCVYSSRDAGIFLKLVGDSAESDFIRLDEPEGGWTHSPLLRKWERNPVETFLPVHGDKKTKKKIEEGKQTFRIKLPDNFPLRQIQRLEIGFDHSRFVDGWLIGKITVDDLHGTKIDFNGPSSLGAWHNGKLVLIRDAPTTEPILPHHFVMGPILGYRGTVDGRYQLCCVVATEGDDAELQPLVYKVTRGEEDPEVIAEGQTSELTKPLATSGNYKLWRYDWEVPRHIDQNYVCRYKLPDSRSFSCHIPSAKTYPRVTFASCAGLKTQEEIRKTKHQNIMYTHMRTEHAQKPFHLMIQGGDQVYADSILVKLEKERKQRGCSDTDTTDLLVEARALYFELYISQWRQPEQAYMFARVPSLMIWDDHDIIDGWGSFRETTPFMREIYKASREMFNLFQLYGLRQEVGSGSSTINIGQHSVQWINPPAEDEREPSVDPGPFSYVVTFGDICFLMIDNRSERRFDQVMSTESWEAFVQVLNVLRGVKHIFLVIAVPVLYANFSSMISLFRKLPMERLRNLEYDIIDHWATPHHDYERRRLIKTLLDYCKDTDTRVTVLSGDVHVGCWGRVESDSGVTIDMVTSSAIVNNPPPGINVIVKVLAEDEKFFLPSHGEVKLALEEVDSTDKGKRLVASQNFLVLDPELLSGIYTGRYHAQFIKKPSETFEKSKPKHMILKEAVKFGRIIDRHAVMLK